MLSIGVYCSCAAIHIPHHKYFAQLPPCTTLTYRCNFFSHFHKTLQRTRDVESTDRETRSPQTKAVQELPENSGASGAEKKLADPLDRTQMVRSSHWSQSRTSAHATRTSDYPSSCCRSSVAGVPLYPSFLVLYPSLIGMCCRLRLAGFGSATYPVPTVFSRAPREPSRDPTFGCYKEICSREGARGGPSCQRTHS